MTVRTDDPNLVFVLDPLADIDPARDTTVELIRAAWADGHRVGVAQLADACLGGAAAWLSALPVLPAITSDRWWRPDGERRAVRVANVNAVFVRVDPPFDHRYQLFTHLLDGVDRGRTAFVNDPRGMREANEKLYALRWPHLCPETLVSGEASRLLAFAQRHPATVLKRLDGYMGRGTALVRRGDDAAPAIIELLTEEGTRPILAQPYLDAVRNGNRRIMLLDGEPIAAVDRFPQQTDFRIGDQAAPTEPTPLERDLCAALAPALRRDGLRFVGIDVIDGLLVDVNVTSPGALRHFPTEVRRTVARRVVRAAVNAQEQEIDRCVCTAPPARPTA